MNQPPILTGTVKPPADMIEAARASLSAEGFAELMAETGGATRRRRSWFASRTGSANR